MSEEPPQLPEGGPTELVETQEGDLVERLSGGTATLLLVWLIGIGGGSGLLAGWALAALIFDTRLGADDLLSATGFYLVILGASGPCVLWLMGRAQGHTLRWFVLAAVRIALVMAAILAGGAALVILGMGIGFGPGVPLLLGVLLATAVMLALIWALAVWAADRWIARARVSVPPN